MRGQNASAGFVPADPIYFMRTFWQWLQETYVTFNPAQYDRLFDEQLEKVIGKLATSENWSAMWPCIRAVAS